MIIISKKDYQQIKKIFELHSFNGNWNYDEYMFGMFNGMEMIMSMIEKREPNLRKLTQNQMLRYQEKSIEPETTDKVVE